MTHLLHPASRSQRIDWLASLWLSLPLLPGCSSGTIRAEKPVPLVAARLLDIGHALNQFIADQGRPPRTPEDLRGWLSEPEAWISPRDGKPFVIVWGFDPVATHSAGTSLPIMAHEKSGTDGTRYVLTVMGNTQVWKDVDFQAYQASAGRARP